MKAIPLSFSAMAKTAVSSLFSFVRYGRFLPRGVEANFHFNRMPLFITVMYITITFLSQIFIYGISTNRPRLRLHCIENNPSFILSSTKISLFISMWSPSGLDLEFCWKSLVSHHGSFSNARLICPLRMFPEIIATLTVPYLLSKAHLKL